MLLLFPLAVPLVFFANEWLSVWLNPEFALQARLVVVWLVIGALINGVAQILFAKVQGAGRSDWTAKLHLGEVLPYLGFLYVSLYCWGISGAAFAWCVRVTIDLIGLLIFTNKINIASFKMLKPALWLLIIAVSLLIASIVNLSLQTRILTASLILLIYVWVSLKELKANGMLEKMMQLLKPKSE